MKKKLLILIALVVALVVVLTACSTSTEGRSPIDGTWDHVEFWNGSAKIWSNDEGGEVTISTKEFKNHSLSSDEGSWVTYSVTYNNRTIYIVDCDSLTIVYWNY